MSIRKIGSDLIRPQGSDGVRAGGSKEKSSKGDAPSVERSDRIEFSAEGRELAAHLVDAGRGAERADYSKIMGRIDSGFYDDPSVAEQVAQELIGRGDLDSDV